MYVTEAMLQAAARRWGEPRRIRLAYDISLAERELIRGSRRDERSHDVTLFIVRDGRFVVIAKPSFPEGVWRAPSGGLHRGEDLEAGARREALEETGLDVELERYLVRVEARFACGDAVEPWQTHVFLARAVGGELTPRDRREIRAARWASREELQGSIRAALIATGRALFRYRVALTDATFEALDGAARKIERQRRAVAELVGRMRREPVFVGALLVGSLASDTADEFSDVDVVVVTADFARAWERRARLHGEDTLAAWDERGDDTAPVGAHKWLTRDVVLVECLVGEPRGLRLAEPFVVAAGPADLADRLPRRGPVRRTEMGPAAHALERAYDALKAAGRAASRGR